MTNDNYKTTGAALVDPPEPEIPARPRNVHIAIGLIVGALLIMLLAILKGLYAANFYVANPRGVAMFAVEFTLLGVICHQIAQRRGWARLVLLMLVLVTFARLCWAIGYVWRQDPDLWDIFLGTNYLLTRILPLVMNFVALHLLYFSSGDWFRPRS